jgi:ATP-dependent DNA ligase
LVARVAELGLEGVVANRLGSSYIAAASTRGVGSG